MVVVCVRPHPDDAKAPRYLLRPESNKVRKRVAATEQAERERREAGGERREARGERRGKRGKRW
jgi:hypothetical protein